MSHKSHAAARNHEVGFFDDPSTQQLIADLASSDTITLYVGAGASTDQGLPTWKRLVTQLLADKIAPPGAGRGSALAGETTPHERVAAYLTDLYQEAPTASIVDGLYLLSHDGAQAAAVVSRNRDIAKILYDPNPDDPEWGSPRYLVTYIALLCGTLKQLGVNVEIATTNYDDSIETSTREDPFLAPWLESRGITFKSFSEIPTELGAGEIPVVHLHGLIPRDDPTSKAVVFSEADYKLALGAGLMQEYLSSRLMHEPSGARVTSVRLSGWLSHLCGLPEKRYD